jgi:crossover junction endodeoxyribonuclease RusA
MPQPTEPRVFLIELPAGQELLNSNHRRHWSEHNRITQELKDAAIVMARSQKVPRLDRVHIVGVHRPVNNRVRDAGNLYPSFKACVDGLVSAGVLSNDDDAHVVGPDMVTGPIDQVAKARKLKHGSLLLVITELPALGQETNHG